ncbi:MAG: nucleoside phosphorylase [Bacteroidales bacterium]
MKYFEDSELILNPDGSIYHLSLHPEQLAGTLILVGDQGRVEQISGHFDRVEHKVMNREFVTHTGVFNNKRVTVLSTGIGTDNIDIVVNELDALVNIDLENRVPKKDHTPLNIVRLGTSGAVQPDIAVDTFVASAYGLGFDGLLNFYEFDESILETDMSEAFMAHTKWNQRLAYPYIVKASQDLLEKVAHDLVSGITATANGFYGPQGRELRIPLAFPGLNQGIESFEWAGRRITNFEMETSALFGLGKILGHNTLTVCAIIANRVRKEYSRDYKRTVDALIELVLGRITS